MVDLKYDVIDALLSEEVLSKLETRKAYSPYTRNKRLNTWDNPQVEYAFWDTETDNSLAVIFANNMNLDVILDDTLHTIQKYSGCVVCFSLNQMDIAGDFYDILKEKDIINLPIAIVVYDSLCNVKIIKNMTISENKAIGRSDSELKSYWCWWRDLSHFEVATLLKLSEKYDSKPCDIYTEYVYPEFYNMMIEGKTKQWDGSPRHKKYSETSRASEKQNSKIPLVQLGLLNSENGHLTEKGRRLIRVIDKNGSDSSIYFNCLAKMILIDGKHLDLIRDLEKFQKEHAEIIPEKAKEFYVLLEKFMVDKEAIGTRKPTAITTGAKNSYIRDEPKIWNKMGLLNRRNGSRSYFHPFKGLDFNWNRINEILLDTTF